MCVFRSELKAVRGGGSDAPNRQSLDGTEVDGSCLRGEVPHTHEEAEQRAFRSPQNKINHSQSFELSQVPTCSTRPAEQTFQRRSHATLTVVVWCRGARGRCCRGRPRGRVAPLVVRACRLWLWPQRRLLQDPLPHEGVGKPFCDGRWRSSWTWAFTVRHVLTLHAVKVKMPLRRHRVRRRGFLT